MTSGTGVKSTTRDLKKDFFRSVGNNRAPDGVNDVTEGIYHDGTVHIGNANINNTSRFEHMGIVSYTTNGNFQNQIIQTNIPIDSITMPLIRIQGYGYGTGDIIDINIGFYVYNAPSGAIINTGWISNGTIAPASIRAGFNGGLLVLEINRPAAERYYRYAVSCYSDGPGGNATDSWFENRIVSNALLPGATTNIVTIVPKAATTTLSVNNDLGYTGGILQTGFPLVRNTTTTGGFYRHRLTNTGTNPALSSSGLLYGYNNNLITGNAWNTSLITSFASFVNGNNNSNSGNYSLVSGISNNNSAYASAVMGASNTATSAGRHSMIQGINNFSAMNYGFLGGINNASLATPITGSGMWYGNALNGGGAYMAVFGGSHTATGRYNGVVGLQTTMAGNYNMASGYKHTFDSSTNGVLASGYEHNITAANRGYVYGQGNQLRGNYNLVGGNTSTFLDTQPYSSVVIGDSCKIGGAYTKTCLGYYNTINTNTHVVWNIGQQNIVGNTSGTLTKLGAGALGINNTVIGAASIAIGANNNLSANNYNYALGYNNAATGTVSNTIRLGNSISSSTVSNAVHIGGASDRLGFFNITPVARQTGVGVTTVAQVVTILRNYGLVI